MADGEQGMADETEPGDEPPAGVQSDEHVKAFFLDLAAKGKEAWNAWRRDPANKDVRVIFGFIDFFEAPRDAIDFSGFEFGDYADFSGCKWRGVFGRMIPDSFRPGGAYFTGAAFGVGASFAGAAFGKSATFTGAAFGGAASFDDAAFGQGARFDGAAFGDGASFTYAAFVWLASFNGAAFGDGASFNGAAFGDGASFAGAAFGGSATFIGAAFGGGASFDHTFFKGRVEFTGKSKEQWRANAGERERSSWIKLRMELEAYANEKGKEARIALENRHKELWKSSGSGPDRFLTISFARARFDGEANFSGRIFDHAADLTTARFYSPPDFDTATNVARIDFTGAHVGFARPGRLHWTAKTKVPVRLRALRKIAEDTKNHDLERDLYIEERKAERGVYLVQRFLDWVKDPKRKWALIAHILWIAVMGVYWALADYGRSFARPAAWLIASGFFFYWCYGKVLAQLMPKAGPLADKYEHGVGMVALGNAVPFVGPLTIEGEVKKFLFCARDANCLPIPPEGFQLLVVGQNLFSITCVFFIGLALRNYFRIK